MDAAKHVMPGAQGRPLLVRHKGLAAVTLTVAAAAASTVVWMRSSMLKNEEEQRRRGYYVPVDRSGGGI